MFVNFIKNIYININKYLHLILLNSIKISKIVWYYCVEYM